MPVLDMENPGFINQWPPCVTHICPVQEVADSEQRRQNEAQGLILLQLIHALLQVL